MRKVLFAAGVAACLLAGGASAEVIDVQPFGGTKIQFGGVPAVNKPAGAGVEQDVPGTSGTTYRSTFEETATSITFEANNTASGPFVQTITTSGMDIFIKNNEGVTILPKLQSSITPAAFGFYLADRTTVNAKCGAGSVFGSCAQYGFTDVKLTDLTPNLDLFGVNPQSGLVRFDFVVLDGADVLYNLFGLISMDEDPFTGEIKLNAAFSQGINNALPSLTKRENSGAFGYSWDAEPIEVDFKSAMAAGETRKITYRSTVTSYSNAECLLGDTLCLLAYAGFGDPLTRTSGTRPDAIAEQSSFATLMSALMAGQPVDPDLLIECLTFDPVRFDIPVFENGVLRFSADVAPVPEPSTWLLILFGIGGVGAALRRRSAVLA